MTVSVLIPWRSDDPHRIQVWDYLRPLWDRVDVQVCSTDDGLTGRFSFAAGANRCRALASGDILLIHGADQFPPSPAKMRWVLERLGRMSWTGVYAHTRQYTQWASRLIMQGHDRDSLDDQSVTAPVAEGIIAVRADVFDDAGGFDERFRGWGAEDVAFRIALKALYSDGRNEGEGTSHTLWHAPAPWDELTTNNNQLCTEYRLAAQAGRMRDYLREVRGDRSGVNV